MDEKPTPCNPNFMKGYTKKKTQDEEEEEGEDYKTKDKILDLKHPTRHIYNYFISLKCVKPTSL